MVHGTECSGPEHSKECSGTTLVHGTECSELVHSKECSGSGLVHSQECSGDVSLTFTFDLNFARNAKMKHYSFTKTEIQCDGDESCNSSDSLGSFLEKVEGCNNELDIVYDALLHIGAEHEWVPINRLEILCEHVGLSRGNIHASLNDWISLGVFVNCMCFKQRTEDAEPSHS